MSRLRFRNAPLWAWILLALAPTVGYLIAEATMRHRTERAPAIRAAETHPFGCVWNPQPHGVCRGRGQ